KEKIIGSTTLDIARDSEMPLYIIPEGVEYKKIEKISFACDIDNLYGSRILENVKSICNMHGAKLEVVNVEKPGMEEEPLRIRNMHFMESNLLDINHTTTVLSEKDSYEALPEYFMSNKPDLILLNPKKQNFIVSLFHKSMTKTMAFHVKAPMLIVH
ncbi:MAG: hypothetical protein IT236_10445, partial [Bacteroidia bacterium]|nr:hypothetical protein [Bacteroidia bacterium]